MSLLATSGLGKDETRQLHSGGSCSREGPLAQCPAQLRISALIDSDRGLFGKLHACCGWAKLITVIRRKSVDVKSKVVGDPAVIVYLFHCTLDHFLH